MASKTTKKKVLNAAQRSKIARAARYAQIKTMNSKAYQRAEAKGRRAIDKFLDSRA